MQYSNEILVDDPIRCLPSMYLLLQWYLILSILSIVSTKHVPKCEHVLIGGVPYRRHLLATLDGYPSNLVYDSRNGNIFFTLHKRNYTKGLYLLQFGSLGIKKLPISDDLKGQCVGVDVPNDIIYIGTSEGLVIYDYSKAEITSEKVIGEDDVKNIFINKFDNDMYILTGSLREIFRMKNGTVNVKRFEKVPRAYNMVMDSKGNIFYEYIDGRLYFFASDLYEPIQFKGFTRELTHILDVNKHDEVVVAVKGNIYRLSATNILPVKIGQLNFKITALTFDTNNNILIGTKGKIYKYKTISDSDPCPADDYFYSNL